MPPLDRRRFLTRMAAGTSVFAAGSSAFAATGLAGAGPFSGESTVPPNDEPAPRHRRSGPPDLPVNPTFLPLPPGSVRPRGWLARQLRIQADGLTGHLDEFWPDVADSGWFGGGAEAWERAPYWLDGLIPLAWALDDGALMEKATRRVEEILRRQRSDGWYGVVPRDLEAEPYDMWAILLMNKVMVQYHQATGDEGALEALAASLRALARSLRTRPLFRWGRYRWFEGLLSVFYLHGHAPEPWLLELGRTLRRQGTDYPALYDGYGVTVPTPRRGLWTWDKHVVNTAMALKAGALSWSLEGREEDRLFPARMLALLDHHHGQVNGMFTGDECLAGRNPIQGTELCAVVELMFSLETLLTVLGEASWGDRLERVAFNALPATFKPDMWAHQYDQQANQAQCTVNPDHMFTTNGPESNIYGLEPNYGCCTANMHQGWPKLATHLWMGTLDGGLAAVAWAPCHLRHQAGGIPVAVTVDTDYPFRETVTLTVRPEAPATFPLLLRVPAWARGATLRLNGGPEEPMEPGTFHRLEGEWAGEERLTLRFPMRPRITLRYNEAVAVERGPLVYALSPREEWRRVNAGEPHRDLPHGDFEVRPASEWRYGLVVASKDAPGQAEAEDPVARARTLEELAEKVEVQERPVGEVPFSPEGAGVVARVPGRKLPDWELIHGWAGEIAPGLHDSHEPVESLTLLPYGCTNIRITEFPRVKG